MSLTKLQDKPIVVGSPIEIENAVNIIRMSLAGLDWVSHPYFIAQRFFRSKEGKSFYYPETYAKDPNSTKETEPYHRLTPDNDYSGMFFFMVGDGAVDYSASEENYITYPVGIIFSANLELIDAEKLKTGLFTQKLMRDARRLITTQQIAMGLDYSIISETRDIRQVYREFTLKEIDSYNRAPMQCFRIDMTIRIQEDCDVIIPIPLKGLYEQLYENLYE